MVFLHPHYGLPNELYGPENDKYGHVLPLALGFPLETTIAYHSDDLEWNLCYSAQTEDSISTLWRCPCPFLAGRIQSCIEHDAHLKKARQDRYRRWKDFGDEHIS